MGIEILENDPRYINFVRSVFPNAYEEPASVAPGPDISEKHIPEPPPERHMEPEFTL